MNEKELDAIFWGVGVDTFNRFQTFLKLAPKLKGRSYWYALGLSYPGSDNLFAHAKSAKAAFLKDEPERKFLMDDEERNFLQELPEQVTIYRGMTEVEFRRKSFGVSWTLDRRVAEFFAFSYGRNHSTNHLKKTVCKITIHKNEVIAFLNGRKESEIHRPC